jgi:hypothetical protein
VRLPGRGGPGMSAKLHLEAPFGDRALLLELDSGFFASREGLAGARYVRDAAAGTEPVHRRDLRRGPRSACTGRHGPVITSAVAVVAPRRTQGYVVRSWGMTLAAIHVRGVHTASLCTSLGDEHRFRPPRPTRGARGVPLSLHPRRHPTATGSPVPAGLSATLLTN